ncbi:sulfite exporter TauE/SafE family protein [Marinobacterium rhizophilum]|uniref:Probable membrane transporter protein n=1 Tax=Marinobacterium rhizophilum TaxID=420402 RepID=A0ABY5HHR4_9GAMM|nr:sulfite exporter TauE/SafE family protein [Marinobacterium rhizophilum]UTW11148.1 sulfite exporter TauE/SafE family protein [Marinobacterium rhizophilum]
MIVFGGSELLLLLCLALASYIQATTGFAFGLIVMACVTALGLAPIDVTALLVGALTLVNAATALRGGLWRDANWRALGWMLAACLPATFVGLALLSHTSEDQLGLLQGTLGVCLIGSSLLMMYRVRQLEKPSSVPAFALCGVLAGLMGGLFAVFGPPPTFMMYRQPDRIASIRATLIWFFSLMSALRLVAVLWTEPVGESFVGLAVLGTPVVVLAAMAARRFPPPLSSQALRRFAFGLLLLSGIGLMVKGFF